MKLLMLSDAERWTLRDMGIFIFIPGLACMPKVSCD